MKDTGDNDDHFYVVPSEKIKNKTLQKTSLKIFRHYARANFTINGQRKFNL